MTPGLDALRRILPPPPIEVASPPWGESSTQVDISFPTDYRDFVAEYGCGAISTARISPDLEVAAPHSWRDSGAESAGFKGFIERHIREYGEFLAAEDASGLHDFRISSYPSPGGLLSWGENSNSDMFFWSTASANSEEWPVVFFQRHPGIFIHYSGGIVDFLVDLLEGRHHASRMMRGGSPRWVMNSDWAQRGLSVSAGPATGLA
jgi:hypothetical protein